MEALPHAIEQYSNVIFCDTFSNFTNKFERRKKQWEIPVLLPEDLKMDTCNMDGAETEIFSELDFVDYGYFYDIDHRWYYVIPGPFRIKMPLELIKNRLDEDDYEFDFRDEVEAKVASFILQDYQEYDSVFADFLKNKGYDAEKILGEISEDGLASSYKLFERYPPIYKYFDDWVLIKTNADNTEISEIIVKKRSKKHVETCNW